MFELKPVMDALPAMWSEVSWPIALLIAWIAGEAGNRWLRLPRISCYGLAGFLMAANQGGFISNPSAGSAVVLANFALGLFLFELGYRINFDWLRVNPWLAVNGVAVAIGTFFAVFFVARLFDLAMVPSLLLASMAMSSSPASLLRVINDARANGQVTERSLHFTAINCVLAVVFFKAIMGYWVLESVGSITMALWSGIVVVLVSAAVGTLFGVAMPMLLRRFGQLTRSATVVLAIAVLLLTALMHALKLSPFLAALAFGFVVRQRRVILPQAQQHFGVLGDLLVVFLFVFVAAMLDWREVMSGLGLALIVIAVRFVVQAGASVALAHFTGTTWDKGLYTGLALTPMSVFAILLFEQAISFNTSVPIEVGGFAALALLLEVLGPVAAHVAFTRAGETHPETRS